MYFFLQVGDKVDAAGPRYLPDKPVEPVTKPVTTPVEPVTAPVEPVTKPVTAPVDCTYQFTNERAGGYSEKKKQETCFKSFNMESMYLQETLSGGQGTCQLCK